MSDDAKADEGWIFEAWRVCSACKGTGQPPERTIFQPTVMFPPSVCMACEGKRRFTESFDVAKLRVLLGLAAGV